MDRSAPTLFSKALRREEKSFEYVSVYYRRSLFWGPFFDDFSTIPQRLEPEGFTLHKE
jgi:hypothetical protein